MLRGSRSQSQRNNRANSLREEHRKGAGDVVEVRYLYAYQGGSLYQPVYLGLRDDIEQHECVVAQMKYKAQAEGA
ncbi:MAG TPA: hypothetical protein PLK19_11325 [Mycobacterium sp.]|nr:hypothetical protein [Mycobacterium sp.]